MNITTDLLRFGIRERVQAIEILQAWNANGLPDGFEYDEVELAFDSYSGDVFLRNGSFQEVEVDGGRLEIRAA